MVVVCSGIVVVVDEEVVEVDEVEVLGVVVDVDDDVDVVDDDEFEGIDVDDVDVELLVETITNCVLFVGVVEPTVLLGVDGWFCAGWGVELVVDDGGWVVDVVVEVVVDVVVVVVVVVTGGAPQ